MNKPKKDTRPLGKPHSWANSNGTYLAGQAAIDGADAVAIEMETKWGAGRLRLLVSEDLREKFDRQCFKINSAIWHGDLEEVRQEAARMVKAWRALDAAAVSSGASRLDPVVWECRLADGTVAAIVRTPEEAHAVVKEGRQIVVYTLDEIATMLGHYREVVTVKDAFPGAEVAAVRRPQPNPLDGIREGVRLEDTLNEPLPSMGA